MKTYGLLSLALGLSLLASQALAVNLFENPGAVVEIGGSPTLLFSDMSNQAFGLGFGHHISLAATTMNQKPLGGKIRLDRYYSRQESLNRANTDYISKDTRLKSMSQQYLMFAVGVEGREKQAGHIFFWEALLGYAMGVSGIVEVLPKYGISEIQSVGIPLMSRFFVSGGVGIKRPYKDQMFLVASGRTFAMIGSPYGGKLENRYYLPLPIMLSVGLEYQF